MIDIVGINASDLIDIGKWADELENLFDADRMIGDSHIDAGEIRVWHGGYSYGYFTLVDGFPRFVLDYEEL